MDSRLAKRSVIYIFLSVCVVMVIYIAYSYIVRCSDVGLSKEEAFEIAEKYVPIHFKGDLTLSNQTFDEGYNEWVYQYIDENTNCKVDLLVDKCGTFDVLEKTPECTSLP